MTGNANNSLDIERLRCAGNEDGALAPSSPEPGVIRLDDLINVPDEGPIRSARDIWYEDVAVLDDWTEHELVLRLYELSDNIGRCLDLAMAAETPKLRKANLKNAVAALKSALVTIRALDRHRHGDTQRIRVDYGTVVATSPRRPHRDHQFTKSDRYVDWAFGQRIDNLTDFEGNCRRRANALSKVRPEELLRGFRNGRFEPDQRTWESQFLGLASWLSGQIVKLRYELDRRYTRGQQHIVVERSKGVRAGKIRKIPLISQPVGDPPVEDANGSFAIAQGVKKAVKEPAYADGY